jgi:hypothetical protein
VCVSVCGSVGGVGVDVGNVSCVEVSKCQGRGDGRKITDHGEVAQLGH